MSSVNAAQVVDNITPAETIQSGWTKYNAHWHEYDACTLTNRLGSSTAAGDVLVVSTANDASAIAGDTVGTREKCVVAMAVITNTSTGEFARSGYVSAIKSTGTINRGEYIRKSATAKCVESTGVSITSTQGPPAGSVGYAVAAASGGFVAAMLFERTTGAVMPRSYLAGLVISNNGSDATNDIDIAVGACRSDDDTDDIVLTSSITKRLDAAWAVGTNQGGLDTGAIANTTYHIWLIKRPDTGVVDALFSTSASAPTMPSNYTKKRRIGSIMRESAAIVAFYQQGDVFQRQTPALDVNALVTGTSANTVTVGIPTGIVAEVWGAYVTSALTTIYFSPLAIADTAPSTSAAPYGDTTQAASRPQLFGPVLTNTSAQFRLRTTGSVTLSLSVWGWKDRRGRDD